MAKIHPTAVVDSSATLADGVEIGAGAVVESDVTIGAGTVLRPHSIVRRYTTLGEKNLVDSFAVLGGDPQDIGFDTATETYVRIGNGNTFREGVTISRATKPGEATTVGDDTLWMANSHAGHDCKIGNRVIIVNAVLLAGHVVVGDQVILAGGTMVHQFCWIGESVMSQGGSGIGMHVPPYVMTTEVNTVVGLNAVGLRRNEALTPEDRRNIKEAFKITYRSHIPPKKAVEEMDACKDWGPAPSRFRDFVRQVVDAETPHKRGLCPHGKRGAK